MTLLHPTLAYRAKRDRRDSRDREKTFLPLTFLTFLTLLTLRDTETPRHPPQGLAHGLGGASQSEGVGTLPCYKGSTVKHLLQ